MAHWHPQGDQDSFAAENCTENGVSTPLSRAWGVVVETTFSLVELNTTDLALIPIICLNIFFYKNVSDYFLTRGFYVQKAGTQHNKLIPRM